MSKEIKLIPDLRFPEFENVGNWELKKVEEFFDVGSSKRVLQKDWTNEGVPFYRTRELVSLSKNEPFGSEIYICENLYEELKAQYGVPSEGDLLVSGVGTLGISYQVKVGDKFYFKDGNVIWFKLEGDLISSYFKYCFESEHIQKQIDGQTSKSTVGTYTITNAKKTEFWYTKNPQEQQKIASCLSSLDELLAAHNDKLDALKDHKKGLMQNLFPQEGETVPKVRFPEFEDDGEWVQDKLNEYLELLTDFEANGSFADVKKNVTVHDEKNYAWYVRATDLENNSDLEKVKYVDEHSYNFLHKTKLFGGELLITKRGEIGKVYFFNSVGGLHATVAPNMYLLKLNEKAVPQFFYYHFTNFEGNHSLKKLNASSTIGALYKDDVKNVELFAPPTIKEQKKIASCLSVVDELITAQTEKIEQLQQHKKGLMQGLFPKIES